MMKSYVTAGLVAMAAIAISAQTQAPKPATTAAPAPKPATAAATPAAKPATPVSATTATALKGLPPVKWTKKTAWGDPDLMAIWNNATSTPMQRDPKFGNRTELTDEELIAAQRDAAVRQQGETEETRASGRGVGAGPTFWYEIGKPRRLTSSVIDPPDGRIPPMTAQAMAQTRTRQTLGTTQGMKLDETMWKRQGEWIRCINRGTPAGMVPTVYNANYQIFQAPGVVVILQEMVHQARIVYTDGRPHLDANIRQWEGDARGHWEGNTLVVESTNFHPESEPSDRGPNVAGGPVHVTEYFTRLSDTDLDYRFTLDAPTLFTRPYTINLPMTTTVAPDRMMEYACIEGDNSVRLTITGLISEKQRGVVSPEPAGRGGRGAPAGAPPAGGGRRGGGAPQGGE